jgi:N6-L-threonylcarbamoyladenine synthase
MTVLGIETSCDETAAAVVRDGREVLSNAVFTQIPLHERYGGVVPEIASRAHVEKITPVVEEALAKFREREPDGRIDAVAVTYGPGLSPALIVGLNAAKGLALALGVPLIAANHMEAHLHTPFLADPGDDPPRPEDSVPAVGLAVSGGHTNWFLMREYGSYETIGQTLDDAAGEAFDKAAKLLGLGYPGGPKVDRISREWLASPDAARGFIPFPKGRPREGVAALAGLPAEMCVSFSGLKTALLRHVESHPEAAADERERARVVASYQEAIVAAVADRTRTALRRHRAKSLIVGGGVSLNSRLREALGAVASEAGVPLLLAKPKYCGDNAAMIAGLAFHRRAISGEAAMAVDVAPSLETG